VEASEASRGLASEASRAPFLVINRDNSAHLLCPNRRWVWGRGVVVGVVVVDVVAAA